MTDRDVFLPVGAQPTLNDLVEQAVHAEELGYDRVWFPETWGRDAVTAMAITAERTDSIGIGTSIANIYSRSPALLGQTAATLQEVSGGRFRLGVGPSGPIVIENWHGEEFGNPLRRTRETIEIARQVVSGEVVSYDGEYFSLDGFRLRCDAPDPEPPSMRRDSARRPSNSPAGSPTAGTRSTTLETDSRASRGPSSRRRIGRQNAR